MSIDSDLQTQGYYPVADRAYEFCLPRSKSLGDMSFSTPHHLNMGSPCWICAPVAGFSAPISLHLFCTWRLFYKGCSMTSFSHIGVACRGSAGPHPSQALHLSLLRLVKWRSTLPRQSQRLRSSQKLTVYCTANGGLGCAPHKKGHGL